MKKICLPLIFILFTLFTNAQAPAFEWVRQIGGNTFKDGFAIATDASGNVYTTGCFIDTVDFDPGPGISNLISKDNYDIFISKMDPTGKLIWAKQLGGVMDDVAYSIAIDASGNIYTTGYFCAEVDFDPGVNTYNLTAKGFIYQDIFISKLDSDGKFIWAKRMGGNSSDGGASITVDDSGNVYTTGRFSGTGDFGNTNLTSVGKNDIFISMHNKSGNFVNAFGIGGTENDIGFTVKTDTRNNVYIACNIGQSFYYNGTFLDLNTNGEDDFFIMKMSNNLYTDEWLKQFGSTSSEYIWDMAIDKSGNIYSTGTFNEQLDLDPGPGTYNLTPVGTTNMFISKLDSNGNFIWAKRMGGDQDTYGYSMALDPDGNIYTTGFFEGKSDFNPAGGIYYNLTSAGYDDIFISKLDASGNFKWAVRIGDTLSDYANAITVDTKGHVYTIGPFTGTPDFDPGTGTSLMTSTIYSDIFIHKMNQDNLGIKDVLINNTFSVYPNPSNGIFNIVLSNPNDQTSIEIYNALGVMVFKTNNKEIMRSIDLSTQANGLYIVKLTTEGNVTQTQKIIKQ